MAAMDAPHQPTEPLPSPFAVPIFRSVWIASLVSNFGGLIQSVGAAWAMTSLSPSPAMVALVQASTALPIMLFALLAGAIADNRDRRQVMMAAQGAMLLISLALAGLAWGDRLSPGLLLLFTFLIGCGAALNGPSWQASVGDMVPRAVLPAAVAANAMGFNIARSLGPALGGAIVAAAGATAAFLMNALSYVGLLWVLARWRPGLPPRKLPPEPLLDAMAAGLRYVALSPGIRLVMLRALAFGLAASAVPALMPLVARDVVAGGPLTFGLLLGAFGSGAVVAALSTARLRARLTTEQVVRLALGAIAAGTAGVGLSAQLWTALPSLALAGGGWVLALSTFNVSVQMAAPRWVVGRALALYQMAAFGGMAVGAWGFGGLAEALGVQQALLWAAAAHGVGAVLALWRPLPELVALDLDPLARWREPSLKLPISPRSGPITVSIAYRIDEADVPQFLEAMAERRRIRRRDGARDWHLLRDLGEPDRWVERYSAPTWLDYVRHNERRTKADAGNWDRIRSLDRSPDGPLVRRLVERQTGSLPAGPEPGIRELAPPLTDPHGPPH